MDFEDLDAAMKQKEELVEKAQTLANQEDLSTALNQANDLRKAWRKTGHFDSIKDQELTDQFEAAMNVIYSKKGEIASAAQAAKEKIVADAQEVLKEVNFKKATEAMNALMDSWKKSGSAGKEKDDELWAKFSEARSTFFANRKEYYAGLTEAREKALEIKEKIVEEAESLAESVEWKKTTAKFDELFQNWKDAGNIAKEKNTELWGRFSAARRKFNEAKNAHYAELRETYSARYHQKLDLIEEAKTLIENSEISKATTEKIKELRTKWKEVGNCGKEKEDAVWQQFNGTINSYFDKLQQDRDSKHQNWVDRQNDNIAYKQEQIARFQQRITRAENDKKTAIGDSQIAQAEDDIQYYQGEIEALQQEIDDIKAKLG